MTRACRRTAWKSMAVTSFTLLMSGVVGVGIGGEDAKGLKPPPRTDRFGDPLPEGAVARIGTARFRAHIHSHLVFSPDSKILAGGEEGEFGEGKGGLAPREGPQQGDLILWDAVTGKELRRWNCLGGSPGLAFSAEGKQLYSAGYDRVVRTWDVATGKELKQFALPKMARTRYAFSPDGTKLACPCTDNSVRLWELATGTEICELRGHQRQPVRVIFSPDGTRLASSGEDKTVRFWRLDTGAEIGKIDITDPAVGKLLATKQAATKLLWLPGDKGLVTALPEGELRLWDTETGKPLGLLGRVEGAIYDLTCSRDGKYLVTASTGLQQGRDDHDSFRNVHVWDVAGRKLLHDVPGVFRAERVTLAPDGTTLALGNWDGSTLWDIERRCFKHPDYLPRSQVLAARFSPNGRVLATTNAESTTYLWEVGSWKQLHRLSSGIFFQYHLEFSADSRLLVGGGQQNCPVIGWDAVTGKERFRKSFGAGLRRGWFWPFALAPHGRLVATGGAVWDLATGKEVAQLPDQAGQLPDAAGQRQQWGEMYYAFAPDGKVLAEALRECIQLYEPRTGKVLLRLEGYPGVVRTLEFSSDGKRLLATEDGEETAPAARLWDVTTGMELGRYLDHNSWMVGPVLSPDGRMFALGGGPKTVLGPGYGSEEPQELYPPVSLWEIASGRPRHRFPGAQRGILTAIAYSPTGRHVITCGLDTTVLVWDVTAPAKAAPAGPLGPAALEALWTDLGDADAAKAYRAICVLAVKPAEAVPFLGGHLRSVTTPDPKKIERLIADLDSDRFASRRDAEAALSALAEQAGPALRRVLENAPSLEQRRRIKLLLEKLSGPVTDLKRLRELRALEVLENIGTTAANQVLVSLAKGDPAARLTQDAKASLERGAKKSVVD